MTATTNRSQLPHPRTSPAPPSFPLTARRAVVLADDPCEAALPDAGPDYAGIYLHARYFDPKLGQFLSADHLDPARPGVGLNRYAYGLGSPTNLTDRQGTDVCFVQVPSMGGGTDANYKNPQIPQVECVGSGPYQGGTELARGESQYANNLALSGHGGVYAYTGADGSTRFTMNPAGVTDSATGDFVSGETGLAIHAELVYPGQRVAENGLSDRIGDLVGKAWNSPNTILGFSVAYGDALFRGQCSPSSPCYMSAQLGHNAIEFTDVGLSRLLAKVNGMSSFGVTIGNVTLYSDADAPTILGDHEIGHTYQGEALGPLYLPANINLGTLSMLTSGNWWENNPLEQSWLYLFGP